MSQKPNIETVLGMGRLLAVESFYGNPRYKVAGEGYSGWFDANQILSNIDSDDTTTMLNFDDVDADDDATSTIVPDDDPHALEGVTLPWNPDPTEEWGDGMWTTLPDGAKVNLDPTKSTKGVTREDDLETSTLMPEKHSAADWDNDASDDDYDRLQDEDDQEHERSEKAKNPRNHWSAYTAFLESDSMAREAAWSDVRAKAKRLWTEGHVSVDDISSREIFARVQGDNGLYDVEIHRKNAAGQGVTWWDCDCGWGKHAYLRKRTFIGRFCSHALATYYAMQSNKSQPDRNVKQVSDTLERHVMARVAAEEAELAKPQKRAAAKTLAPWFVRTADGPTEPVKGDDGENGDTAEGFVPDEWDKRKVEKSSSRYRKAASGIRWDGDGMRGQTHDGYHVELEPDQGGVNYHIHDGQGNGHREFVEDQWSNPRYADDGPTDDVLEHARNLAEDDVHTGVHRQAGLLIWDDDLHKAIKNLMPQPDAMGGAPAAPPASAMSADPSAMGADPAAGGLPGDPAGDPMADPAMGGTGDPGAPAPGGFDPGSPEGDMGGLPDEMQPFFVRDSNMPTPKVATLHTYASDDDWDSTYEVTQSPDDSEAHGADFVTWEQREVGDAVEDDSAFNGDELAGWDRNDASKHSSWVAGDDPDQVDDPEYDDYLDDNEAVNHDDDVRQKRADLASFFEDDNFSRSASYEAEEFNTSESANDIIAQFQRTAGRNFSFAEQQELIEERPGDGYDDYADLDLRGTHYR